MSNFSCPVQFYWISVFCSKYFVHDCRFNGIFSTDNLPRIKDGAYVINLDNKQSKGTQWVSLFIDINTALYFDSFGTEYISQELLRKIKDKSITQNILYYIIYFIVLLSWNICL